LPDAPIQLQPVHARHAVAQEYRLVSLAFDQRESGVAAMSGWKSLRVRAPATSPQSPRPHGVRSPRGSGSSRLGPSRCAVRARECALPPMGPNRPRGTRVLSTRTGTLAKALCPPSPGTFTAHWQGSCVGRPSKPTQKAGAGCSRAGSYPPRSRRFRRLGAAGTFSRERLLVARTAKRWWQHAGRSRAVRPPGHDPSDGLDVRRLHHGSCGQQ
jgi:hypothetical protein